MDEVNVVSRLIALFGTQSRLAVAAGCAQSTMSERQKRNSLTHAQMRRILAVGREWGVPVRPDDFFPELIGRTPKSKRKTAA